MRLTASGPPVTSAAGAVFILHKYIKHEAENKLFVKLTHTRSLASSNVTCRLAVVYFDKHAIISSSFRFIILFNDSPDKLQPCFNNPINR